MAATYTVSELVPGAARISPVWYRVQSISLGAWQRFHIWLSCRSITASTHLDSLYPSTHLDSLYSLLDSPKMYIDYPLYLIKGGI